MTPRETTPFRIAAAFAAVYLIWGSTYLAIRFAVETIPPFLMAGVRFVIAGGSVVLWYRLRGVRAPGRIEWRAAAVVGALMLLGGNGLVSWAEQFVSSGLAALLVATAPIWLVLIAWLGPDRDRPGRAEVVGLAVGLFGVALLATSGDAVAVESATGGPGMHRWGALAIIIASIAWAAGSIYSRRAPAPEPALYSTGLTMLAGGVALLVTSGLTGEPWRFQPEAVSARSLVALAYLIVFGALIGFSAYTWLLKVTRPALVGTYAYVNPVVAVWLGWWIADEVVTVRMLAGMTIILFSVLLIERGRRAKARPCAAYQPCVKVASSSQNLARLCTRLKNRSRSTGLIT